MWNGTRIMAENIANGICQADKEVNVKLFNAATSDKNDVVTEIFKSKVLLLGSPTINNGIQTSIAALLEELKGLKLKNKKASCFGCYGWSGEGNNILSEQLQLAGFDLIDPGIKALWNPNQEAINACRDYGVMLVGKV